MSAFIYPVFTDETACQHSQTDEEYTVIRGVMCKKTELITHIPVYFNGLKMDEPIWYFRPVLERETVLEKGLRLASNKSEYTSRK